MNAVTLKANVLILDSEPAARLGLARLVNAQARLRVCAEADTVATAALLCTQHQPDLVVLDLEVDDGFNFLKDLRKWSRRARAVVHSRLADATTVQRAMAAGAVGYVARRDPAEALVEALLAALAGERHVGPRIGHAVLEQLAHGGMNLRDPDGSALSPRETEVFRLLGEGCTTVELAARLHRSRKTIETHVERIKHKLGITSGAELRRRAVQTHISASAMIVAQTSRKVAASPLRVRRR